MNKANNEKSGPGPQNTRIWNGPCHFFANVIHSKEWIWRGDASDHGMSSADFLRNSTDQAEIWVIFLDYTAVTNSQ